MKRIVLLMTVLLTAAVLHAQRITKVYGFWHYQPMGNIPKIPVEEGGGGGGVKTERPERRKIFYVYIESSAAKAPEIQKITLQGKVYTAAVQKIETLPAEYVYFDGRQESKITLVPKGRKNVFALALTESNETAKAAGSGLTINYKPGKKMYKASLARMKELPMAVVQ